MPGSLLKCLRGFFEVYGVYINFIACCDVLLIFNPYLFLYLIFYS